MNESPSRCVIPNRSSALRISGRKPEKHRQPLFLRVVKKDVENFERDGVRVAHAAKLTQILNETSGLRTAPSPQPSRSAR
jgi:hypothetical protein